MGAWSLQAPMGGRDPCKTSVGGKESKAVSSWTPQSLSQKMHKAVGNATLTTESHAWVFEPVHGSGTRRSASTTCAGLSPGAEMGSGCSSDVLPTKARTDPPPALPRPPAPCTNHHLAALLPWGSFFNSPLQWGGRCCSRIGRSPAWDVVGAIFYNAELFSRVMQ